MMKRSSNWVSWLGKRNRGKAADDLEEEEDELSGMGGREIEMAEEEEDLAESPPGCNPVGDDSADV
jgi:hypothetical protein